MRQRIGVFARLTSSRCDWPSQALLQQAEDAADSVLLPDERRPIMLAYVEALSVVGVVFAFLLIVFLVLAFRFPDDLRKLLGRMTSVEVTRMD
jgi:hypothetical protein